MGRETACMCEWNGDSAQVKALVETQELILRGDLRRRIPFTEMKNVKAEADRLSFRVGSDRVNLTVGETVAAKWANIIVTPPPNLAKKLGILSAVTVRTIGKIDDNALRDALVSKHMAMRGKADVILARVNTPDELAGVLNRASELTQAGVPLWIIYRKGRGHAIKESDVRSAGLAAGLVDVKVAAVSAELTGLKFVMRKRR
jgi:hypothetical protein